jgi:hypothetical protein
MATVANNLALCRQRLGEPDRDILPDHRLLGLLVDALAHHTAQLANARYHWSVGSAALQVVAGTEDYALGAQDFGRPILVHTEDTTNTYHVRTEVPFTLIQDINQRYTGPQQTGSSYQHTAVTMAFYFSSGQPYAKVVPVPGGSGTYRVWYEAVTNFTGTGQNIGLSPFHHLVRAQACLSALPWCKWGEIAPDGKAQAWEMRVRSLRDTLVYDEQKWQKEFDYWRHTGSREQVHNKILWGPADYDGDEEGGVMATSNWGGL